MAREIDMKELHNLVMEEVEKVEKDLKKAKAKKVKKPGDYANTLAKKIDWEAKLDLKPSVSCDAILESLKLKEEKAMKIVKMLRAKREAISEQINNKQIKEENARLREAIRKVKVAK